MMTMTKMLCARAGATAIAAALALPSTPALAQSAPAPAATAAPASTAAPAAQKPKIKPIIDLSVKPAPATPTPAPAPAQPTYALGDSTLMLGGGALALLALGGVFALTWRRRRRQQAEWQEDATEPEAHDPLFDEPMFRHQPATTVHDPAGAAFAWGNVPRHDPVGEDCRSRETWVERAKCGPTPDNPSLSLRTRLKRAAFFDKREREVAAGQADPVEPDAGLPEAMVEEQERELA